MDVNHYQSLNEGVERNAEQEVVMVEEVIDGVNLPPGKKVVKGQSVKGICDGASADFPTIVGRKEAPVGLGDGAEVKTVVVAG